jgi:DNA-binding cell septation regulator SpoVG
MKSFWVDTSVMTDGELADLIHELANEFRERIRKINTGNYLQNQLEAARLEVRSWPTQKQNLNRIMR